MLIDVNAGLASNQPAIMHGEFISVIRSFMSFEYGIHEVSIHEGEVQELKNYDL